MMLLIYGENSYLCRRALRDITASMAQRGMQVEYFFCAGQGADSRDLEERLRQDSLWGEKKKVFVFLQPFANGAFQEAILQVLASQPAKEGSFLFYGEGVPPAGNELFLFLKRNAKCYECRTLKGRALLEWIRKEVRTLGGAISPPAVSQLAWWYGGDLWRLENEIKKLTAFARNRTISPKDIAEICSHAIQASVFHFVDAVTERNRKEATAFLCRKIAEGEDPLRLMAALVAQFRRIIVVREALSSPRDLKKVQARWNMHPYVFQKTLSQARKFSPEELKKIYRALFAADIEMKTGSQPAHAALESFLLNALFPMRERSVPRAR